MTLRDAQERLNIEVDLIPVGASNRPGTFLQPSFLTIHNTANVDADARAHGRYVKSEEARRRKVSWHYSVDSVRVVKHLPLSEMGWHAGKGNSLSIGIEVCEFSDREKQQQANERAALLVALLMRILKIQPVRVVTHKKWTDGKKHCPRQLLSQPGGFAAFRARCVELWRQIEE